MRLRSWLLLLGAGALVTAGAWWSSTRAGATGAPQPAALALRWEASSPVSYDLRVESVTSGLATGGAPQRSLLEGVLTFVAARPSARGQGAGEPASPLRLRAQLSDVRQVPAAAAAGLGRPFSVTFAADGTIEQLEPSAQVPAEVRGRLDELVRLFEHVVPADAGLEGQAWLVRQSHTLGSYRARYLRQGARVLKQKLEYLDAAPGDGELGELGRMRVVRSSGEALPSQTFWLEQATVDESVELVLGDVPGLRFDVRASLVRRQEPVPGFPLEEPPALAPPAAVASTSDAGRQAVPAAPPADSQRRFEEALRGLIDTEGRSVEAYLALKAALRDDPALTTRVLDLLTSGELVDPLEATLVLALERAGHEPAQVALATLAEDSDLAALLRLRAVVALGGVDEPCEAILPTLWGVYRQRHASIELSDTAALAIGSVGRRLRELDPARYEALRRELYGSLASARLDGERSALLTAMGNTADPHFSSYIGWWMEAGSTLVRAAAASALGYLADPGADRDVALDLLVLALPAESEPRVRASIARSLVRLGRSHPQAVEVVASELAREETAEAGYRMATYLLEQLPEHPEVRPVLEDLLARTTSRRLRDLLIRSL